MRYYANVGDFSNRFSILAFKSRSARDAFVRAEREGMPRTAITAKQARHYLANIYDPGTVLYEAPGFISNVYRGSRDEFREEAAYEGCRCSIASRDLPNGACERPVRL